jgi:hypothetical protein
MKKTNYRFVAPLLVLAGALTLFGASAGATDRPPPRDKCKECVKDFEECLEDAENPGGNIPTPALRACVQELLRCVDSH